MPRRVYLYVSATCAIGLAVFVATLITPGLPPHWSWWGAGLLLVAMILAEAGAVELTRESDHALHVISISTIPHVAAILLLPAWLAALVAGAGMLIDECRARRPVLQLSFNVACTTGSVGLAAMLAGLFGLTGDSLGNGDWLQLPALLSIVATYYATNTVPVAGIGDTSELRLLRRRSGRQGRLTRRVGVERSASTVAGSAAISAPCAASTSASTRSRRGTRPTSAARASTTRRRVRRT